MGWVGTWAAVAGCETGGRGTYPNVVVEEVLGHCLTLERGMAPLFVVKAGDGLWERSFFCREAINC